MFKKNIFKNQDAWLLDEDVLVKGVLKNKTFYPSNLECGFNRQSIRRKDIGKILFLDLEEAKKTTGL